MKKYTLTKNLLSVMIFGISINTYANHIDTESNWSKDNEIWIDNSFNIGLDNRTKEHVGNSKNIFKIGFVLDQDVQYFSNFYRASAHQGNNAFDHAKWKDNDYKQTLDGGFTTQELYQFVILSNSDVKLNKLKLYSDTNVYDSPVNHWEGKDYRDTWHNPDDHMKLQPIDHYTYKCMKVFSEGDDSHAGAVLTTPIVQGAIDLSQLPYNTLTNKNRPGHKDKDTLHLTMVPFNDENYDDKCVPSSSDNYDSTDVLSVFVTIKPTNYFDTEDSDDPNTCVIGGNRIRAHTVINGINPDYGDRFTIQTTTTSGKQPVKQDLVDNNYKIKIQNTQGVFSSGCEGVEIPHWETTEGGIRYVGPFTHLLENRGNNFKIRIKANTVIENFPINNGRTKLEFDQRYQTKDDLKDCQTALDQLTHSNQTPISTLFQNSRVKDEGNDKAYHAYNDYFNQVESQCFWKLNWKQINYSTKKNETVYRNQKGTTIEPTSAPITVDGFGVLEGNGPKGSIDSMPRKSNGYVAHDDEKYNRFYLSSGPCNFAQAIRYSDTTGTKTYDDKKWEDMEGDFWNTCDTPWDVAKEAEWKVQAGTLAFATKTTPVTRKYSIDVSGITVSFGDLRKTGNVELNSINSINDTYIPNDWEFVSTQAFNDMSKEINQPVKLYDFKNINFSERADGPAITADHSYAGELYIVAGDDSIKPMANDQIFENSTVLQGNSGSAIMLGQYGNNRGLNHVLVQNIIIPRIEQFQNDEVQNLDPWNRRMSVIGTRWGNDGDQYFSPGPELTKHNEKPYVDSKIINDIHSKWGDYKNHYTDILVKNVTVERLGDDNVPSKNTAYMDYEDLNNIYRFVSLDQEESSMPTTLFEGIKFENVTSNVIPESELRDHHYNFVQDVPPYEIIDQAHDNWLSKWLYIDLTGLKYKVLSTNSSLTYRKVCSGYKNNCPNQFYNLNDGDENGNGKLGENDFNYGVKTQ
ncbi:hypothetical protein CF386_09385 [Paraphotobacterium marinum]|uniref:Uncharacterized protein n=1 Tax=Paraphotobacterium marinum TaxID=1755811 RepID=A0A220VH59_9GAMM|nr:hypothetical protein [Paraphotobacterium marinum]ASK79273.1 hypothetical protein CF386_09385 [Paraphotobacterium marinum]